LSRSSRRYKSSFLKPLQRHPFFHLSSSVFSPIASFRPEIAVTPLAQFSSWKELSRFPPQSLAEDFLPRPMSPFSPFCDRRAARGVPPFTPHLTALTPLWIAFPSPRKRTFIMFQCAGGSSSPPIYPPSSRKRPSKIATFRGYFLSSIVSPPARAAVCWRGFG